MMSVSHLPSPNCVCLLMHELRVPPLKSCANSFPFMQKQIKTAQAWDIEENNFTLQRLLVCGRILRRITSHCKDYWFVVGY